MSHFQYRDIDLNAGNIVQGRISNIDYDRLTASVDRIGQNIPIHYHCADFEPTGIIAPFDQIYPDENDMQGAYAFREGDIVLVMYRRAGNRIPVIIGFPSGTRACGIQGIFIIDLYFLRGYAYRIAWDGRSGDYLCGVVDEGGNAISFPEKVEIEDLEAHSVTVFPSDAWISKNLKVSADNNLWNPISGSNFTWNPEPNTYDESDNVIAVNGMKWAQDVVRVSSSGLLSLTTMPSCAYPHTTGHDYGESGAIDGVMRPVEQIDYDIIVIAGGMSDIYPNVPGSGSITISFNANGDSASGIRESEESLDECEVMFINGLATWARGAAATLSISSINAKFSWCSGADYPLHGDCTPYINFKGYAVTRSLYIEGGSESEYDGSGCDRLGNSLSQSYRSFAKAKLYGSGNPPHNVRGYWAMYGEEGPFFYRDDWVGDWYNQAYTSIEETSEMVDDSEDGYDAFYMTSQSLQAQNGSLRKTCNRLKRSISLSHYDNAMNYIHTMFTEQMSLGLINHGTWETRGARSSYQPGVASVITYTNYWTMPCARTIGAFSSISLIHIETWTLMRNPGSARSFTYGCHVRVEETDLSIDPNNASRETDIENAINSVFSLEASESLNDEDMFHISDVKIYEAL